MLLNSREYAIRREVSAMNSVLIHCLFAAYSVLIRCLFGAYSVLIRCLFGAYSLYIGAYSVARGGFGLIRCLFGACSLFILLNLLPKGASMMGYIKYCSLFFLETWHYCICALKMVYNMSKLIET